MFVNKIQFISLFSSLSLNGSVWGGRSICGMGEVNMWGSLNLTCG